MKLELYKWRFKKTNTGIAVFYNKFYGKKEFEYIGHLSKEDAQKLKKFLEEEEK